MERPIILFSSWELSKIISYFFGILRPFSYNNKTVDDIQGYTRDHERLEVSWKNVIKGDHRYLYKRNAISPVTIDGHIYVDKKVYPPAVCNEYVILLTKKKDTDLLDLNHFIADEVEMAHYFATPEDWNGKI